MGPRSVERGRLNMSTSDTPRDIASMGPHWFERGRVRSATRISWTVIRESDIGGLGIEIVDAVAAEPTKYGQDNAPFCAKQGFCLSLPVIQDLLGKIRWMVDVRFREIQDAGREYDCHFNNQKAIIKANELREREAFQIGNADLVKASIGSDFAFVPSLAVQRFDGRIASCGPDFAVVSVGKCFFDRNALLFGILQSTRFQRVTFGHLRYGLPGILLIAGRRLACDRQPTSSFGAGGTKQLRAATGDFACSRRSDDHHRSRRSGDRASGGAPPARRLSFVGSLWNCVVDFLGCEASSIRQTWSVKSYVYLEDLGYRIGVLS